MASEEADRSLIKSELAIAAVKAVGAGDKEPESPTDEFVRACADYLRTWQHAHTESRRHAQQAPAMFVFSRDAIASEIWPGAAKVNAFKQTCALHLGGALYICNGNLKLVYQAPGVFNLENDALDMLDKRGLKEFAAVIFLPEQDAILVHYPNVDLDDAERFNLGRLVPTPFTFDDLDEHLKQYYIDAVATHKGDCDIWVDAGKRKLKPLAERQIHRSLNMYLRLTIGRYGAKVDREVDSRWEGRSDLRILKFENADQWKQAILELKVLRPTGKPSALEWALEGVDQLVRYRTGEEQQTVACYLCCYDARNSDEEMPDVDRAAAANDVKHRRYFMKTPGCGL